MPKSRPIIALALLAFAPGLALASDEPAGNGDGNGNENGRYEMRQTEGGFIRLDKQTGAMSFCTGAKGRLVCRLGADEREAYQQALAGLEERLKSAEDRIDGLETSLAADPPRTVKRQDRLPEPRPEAEIAEPETDPSERQETQPGEADDPSVQEREFDRAMEFTQRAMRRFFEVIQDLRKEMDSENQPTQ